MAKKINSKGKGEQAYKRLALALGLLLFIVVVLIIVLQIPFWSGKEIILDTRPVDPFDMFRGQYMTINYEISRIPKIQNGISDEDYMLHGKTVYVILDQDMEGIYRYQYASLEKPADVIFIKGKIIDVFENEMVVQYGIEQYFFERDASVPTQGITVKAKVSSGGQARIVELLQNGKPAKIEYQKPSLTS